MNCKQIQNLLYYYIYNELNPALQEYISMHLEECPICTEHYSKLAKEIKTNKNFEQLSAYIDNELSEKENIQVKKNIITNKNIRNKYEKLCSLKSLLQSSMLRQEYNFKKDFSKSVLKNLNLSNNTKLLYQEITGIFIIIFMGLFLITLAIIGI